MAAIPDLDLARIRSYCEQRVPLPHRDALRVEMMVDGRTVTIVERRPGWHAAPGEWSEEPVARLRYSATAREWTLFWSDSNGRWHRYDFIEPGSVATLLAEIERDPTGIFWG